jgi:hypothetical protein
MDENKHWVGFTNNEPGSLWDVEGPFATQEEAMKERESMKRVYSTPKMGRVGVPFKAKTKEEALERAKYS